MSEALRKRGREPEALLDDSIDVEEPKRFRREETDHFLHLQQLDKTLADDDEEEYSPSEELVNGVMRSLEEEIAATCSTSSSYQSSNSGGNLAAADTYSDQTPVSDSGVDLCYLLEASDDELGIPLSPVLDSNDKICSSPKETSEGFSDATDLKFLGENWHFDDEFENYKEFPVYEDLYDASEVQDYMNRDFVSQGLLFDAELSTAWKLETASGM